MFVIQATSAVGFVLAIQAVFAIARLEASRSRGAAGFGRAQRAGAPPAGSGAAPPPGGCFTCMLLAIASLVLCCGIASVVWCVLGIVSAASSYDYGDDECAPGRQYLWYISVMALIDTCCCGVVADTQRRRTLQAARASAPEPAGA